MLTQWPKRDRMLQAIEERLMLILISGGDLWIHETRSSFQNTDDHQRWVDIGTSQLIVKSTPIQFSPEFDESFCGAIIQCPEPTSIGKKRNLAAELVQSQYIATMDDDDLSLPNRLTTQLQSIGKGVYHRTGMVFVAVDELSNIIGQKLGLYHGTMMILREVASPISNLNSIRLHWN